MVWRGDRKLEPRHSEELSMQESRVQEGLEREALEFTQRKAVRGPDVSTDAGRLFQQKALAFCSSRTARRNTPRSKSGRTKFLALVHRINSEIDILP
jgi:hypothetical protein